MNEVEAWQDVLDNEGLVKWGVRKFIAKHPRWGFDEFLTAGYVGCFKAAKNYDPSLGFTKGTYYSTCIYHEMCREAEALSGGRLYGRERRPIQELLTKHGSLETFFNPDGLFLTGIGGLEQKLREKAEEESFEDALAIELDHRAVRRVVDQLDADYREIVLEHYWEGKTYREIGEDQGVSRQAVQQRAQKAHDQLRVLLERANVA